MPLVRNSDSNGRISTLLSDVADGLGRLVTQHIALARAELRDELGALSKSIARAAAFLCLVLVGYGFLCAALVAYLAAQGMSTAAALLLVGAANLVIGAAGAYPPLRRISARRLMNQTLDQLDRSAAALLPVGSGEQAKVADDQRL